MEIHSPSSQQSRWYIVFLLAVVAGYSAYLLSFTLFDGFSTFSNDAASYVLMARKWSPYFDPSQAEIFTIPFHSYPPGFPWLLALTGASESLWSAHLLVSICMLASLLVMGLIIGRQSSGILAALTMLSICLLPGIVVNSMGILSENLYLLLSLFALAAYGKMRNCLNVSWGWSVCLFVFITAAVMTRMIGVALVAAFLVVPALDRRLTPPHRILIPLLALLSFAVWRGWEAFRPDQASMTYGDVSSYFIAHGSSLGEQLIEAWRSVYKNLIQLLWAWNHYFFLGNFHPWYFFITFGLLALCTVSLGLRIAKFRIDAVYITFYLGAVLLWPFPSEMDRFLHPISLLVLAQPILYFSEQNRHQRRNLGRVALAGVMLAVAIHAAFTQVHLFKLQQEARTESPHLVHSYEYYAGKFGNHGLTMSHFLDLVVGLIKKSSERIPETSVVASVKHDNYAILAQRKAVLLSSLVPLHQQICNFLLLEVDTVFLTPVTSTLNPKGLNLLAEYEPFALEVMTLRTEDIGNTAFVIRLDSARIDEELSSVKFECDEVLYAPTPESIRKAIAKK